MFLPIDLFMFCRRPNSGEAVKKPSRPSSAAQEKASDKKKEMDARERRRKEMAQNQVTYFVAHKNGLKDICRKRFLVNRLYLKLLLQSDNGLPYYMYMKF